VTATVTLAVLAGSAEFVAFTEWVPPVAGGVYKPVALIVPTDVLPPTVPSTSQVTETAPPSADVATKVCTCEVVSAARPGETMIATPPPPPLELVPPELLLEELPLLLEELPPLLDDPLPLEPVLDEPPLPPHEASTRQKSTMVAARGGRPWPIP
jgi:hypothetical protein